MENPHNSTTLDEKRKDAGDLISEVISKVPDSKKPELLKLVEGFALCAESSKKAG